MREEVEFLSLALEGKIPKNIRKYLEWPLPVWLLPAQVHLPKN